MNAGSRGPPYVSEQNPAGRPCDVLERPWNTPETGTCSYYGALVASLVSRPNETLDSPLGRFRVSTSNSLTVEDLGSAAQRDRRKRILDATIALATQGGFD